ncbi:MAG: type II toxin-antitoxin system PemK/MazF family toxin [Candidatus Woesearchaeota archaeon]
MRKHLLTYNMQKYDIILVNFPFSDLSQTKLRPALVVAQNKGDNCVLCQITTKHRNINDFELTLLQKDTIGNITFDSNIYVDMIFTLHKHLIVKHIGRVKSLLVKKNVSEKLTLLFA